MWDERFDRPEYVYGTAPAQFLARRDALLGPGQRALAVADGEGRNSVFMAEKGCDVTAMDGSSVGLAKAAKLAEDRGVSVDFRHADLRTWDWTEDSFDLVAAIHIQFADPAFRAAIFDGMQRTLRPGGLLLLHGYTPAQLDHGTGGPGILENLYTPDLLRDAFAGMEIIELTDYEIALDEGPGHRGMSALIDLVARKPD